VSIEVVMLIYGTNNCNSAIVADIIDLYFRVEASKGKRPFVYSIYFPLCR
jgi:hypothetical protein